MVKECDREWVVVQQNVAVERREFCAMKWSSRSGGGAEVEEEQRRAEREREDRASHTLPRCTIHLIIFGRILKNYFATPQNGA